MILLYLIKVSFLLGVLTLAYRWLVRYETFSHTNRLILLLNIVAAWTLPLIPLYSWGPVEVQKQFHQVTPKVIDTITPVVKPVSTHFQTGQIASTSLVTAWDFMDWIVLIYTMGLVIHFALLLFSVSKLVVALIKAPFTPTVDSIRLIEDSSADSPYSFFKWVIYNPDQHSKDELRYILAHEMEHIRQGHSLDLLLAEVQRILLWFNPFAKTYRKMIQDNLEFLVDRAVLEQGFEKKTYQMNLLRLVLNNSAVPLTNSFAQSSLKTRIKMMNKTPSNIWVLWKYAFLLVVLYGSTAFVAPWKKEVIKLASISKETIAQKIAERPIITPETVVLKPEEQAPELAKTKDRIEVKSKWVIIKNDTLYWAISPLTKWDEITQMKEEIRKFGAEFNVTTYKMDHLGLFINELQVQLRLKGATGTGNVETETDTPFKGYYGSITMKALSMGGSSLDNLSETLTADYQKALALQKENRFAYLEYRISQSLKNSTTHKYTKTSYSNPNNLAEIFEFGVLKSINDPSSFNSSENESIEYYLNEEKSTLEEINRIADATFAEIAVIRGDHKTFILASTK